MEANEGLVFTNKKDVINSNAISMPIFNLPANQYPQGASSDEI